MAHENPPKPGFKPEDDRAALLLPPSPPPLGTIRLLIGAGCTWTVRRVADATQVDLTMMPPLSRRTRGERP